MGIDLKSGQMTSLGQALREEREARNISIEEIASATKIVSRYIEALENDRFDIMPGGFFIKGIIRTYAQAIGLDGEEVLARYRAAGVFGESERKRPPFLKSEPAPTARPVAPPVTEAPVEPGPKPSDDTTQLLITTKPPAEPAILPAPTPRLDQAAKKRIIGWAVRGALIVLAVAVLIILLTSRRPKPSAVETATAPPVSAPAQAVVPPPQAPATETRSEPEPAVEEVWTGVTIEISFEAETWIQVYTDGVLKIDGLFPPGAKAQAQANERLLIHVGNAGGFTFLLNGKPAKPLGRAGQVITDIRITPDNIKDFLQAGTPGEPAG